MVCNVPSYHDFPYQRIVEYRSVYNSLNDMTNKIFSCSEVGNRMLLFEGIILYFYLLFEEDESEELINRCTRISFIVRRVRVPKYKAVHNLRHITVQQLKLLPSRGKNNGQRG
jgi:hypothetical protein